jgi:hypothetical protein
MASVFVTEWKAVEKIFDRDQAGALEIRSAPRSDPLEKLQGRGKQIVCLAGAFGPGTGPHCTIMA